VVQAVGEVAAGRGVPRAQVALAWLLQRPVVTAPIIGASKPQHLVDAVAALELKLSPDEVLRLEEAYAPHRAANFG
jgi:aryl-alcohol dehydrogenase-like predicted oxidoreductase